MLHNFIAIHGAKKHKNIFKPVKIGQTLKHFLTFRGTGMCFVLQIITRDPVEPVESSPYPFTLLFLSFMQV